MLGITFALSLLSATIVSASPVAVPKDPRSLLSAYAPEKVACPNGAALVRPATGLSEGEQTYISQRKPIADAALAKWLSKTNPGFATSGSMPTVALTTSGGGYRTLLVGAGVIQGLDERDSSVSTSGLYQGLTYQAALSGGAWLLSSFAGNNYPTITSLKESLWDQAFQDSLFDPGFLQLATAYVAVATDILAKNAAGFAPTIIDPWGRLLSYQLLNGNDGGVSTTLSSIATLSNFTNHNVPFPIMTSLGVKTWDGECKPGPNATTYEFNPFEFGSWDNDLAAFAQTAYLGSSLSAGSPTGSTCIKNYDNLGYVLGTSSNLFNEACIPSSEASALTDIDAELSKLVAVLHQVGTRDEYAAYPNPFFQYSSTSPSFFSNPANPISQQPELHLADGGEALQENPIFPLLQPARNVDVILVNDNSGDTSNNLPNGTSMITSYVQSFNQGLTRMPFIPSVDTILSEGLNQHAVFFGCNDTSKVTIVWLPNVEYTFASGTSTFQLEYPTSETASMIGNGVSVVTQNGDDGWATCLGCAIMEKTGSELPTECGACFQKYCYGGS